MNSQDIYAKNLPAEFGYPLRTPEPTRSSFLPVSYQEDGLQIGDVGYVDRYGSFHVLFNICHPGNHDSRRSDFSSNFEPIDFDSSQIEVVANSIPSGNQIYSPHIRLERPERPEERLLYRFVTSSPSGAILILPTGTISSCLNRTGLENFRRFAIEHARSWCATARRDSLYLITGYHKARSWSLCSFSNAPSGGEILVMKPNEHDQSKIHEWMSNFPVDWRASSADRLNQTVFITGFKIESRWWLPDPEVQVLQEPSNTRFWSAPFFQSILHLPYTVIAFWWRYPFQRRKHVVLFTFILASVVLLFTFITVWPRFAFRCQERVVNRYILFAFFCIFILLLLATIHFFLRESSSSRDKMPFHHSDIINRYLLDKNPNAQVVVTHDTQWMDKLIRDGIGNESFLAEVLRDKHVTMSDNGVISLQSEDDVSVRRDAQEAYPTLDKFSLHTPVNTWMVISSIRADKVITGLSRQPVGFYVFLHFNGIEERTELRSTTTRERVVEWDNEITLHNDPSTEVRLTFYAAFDEFDLNDGLTLGTANTTVGDLVDGTTLIELSSEGKRCSSLMFTAERRHSLHFEAYPKHNSSNQDMSSALSREIVTGRVALPMDPVDTISPIDDHHACEQALLLVYEHKAARPFVRRALFYFVSWFDPCQLRQLVEVLAIDLDKRTMDPDRLRAAFGLELSLPDQQTLETEIGAALLRVLGTLVTHDETTDHIAFSKLNMKDYLIDDSALRQFHVDEQEAHEVIAATCMCYISLYLRGMLISVNDKPAFSISLTLEVTGDVEDSSLLKYVLSNSFNHLSRLGTDNEDILGDILALETDIQEHPTEWEHMREMASHDRTWPSAKHDFALFILVTFAPVSLLIEFLHYESLISRLTQRGETNPLIYAAYFHKIDHARLLLSLGANPNCRGWLIDDSRQVFPLEVAVRGRCEEMVELLLQHRASLHQNLLIDLVSKPLDFTLPIVKKLIQTREFANWAGKNQDNHLPLHPFLPLEPSQDDTLLTVIWRLVQVGFDPHMSDRTGHTALHLAVAGSHSSVVEYLISIGVQLPPDILFSVLQGKTSGVHRAKMVRFLFRAGADMRSISPTSGDTALHAAIKNEHPSHWQQDDDLLEVVKALVNLGCDLRLRNDDRYTPLHLAILRGDVYIVKYLALKTFPLPNDLSDTIARAPSIVRDEIRDMLAYHN